MRSKTSSSGVTRADNAGATPSLPTGRRVEDDAVRQENEELRQRVVSLEAALRALRDDGGAEDLAARLADIEIDHHNLAQLYVATYQMHGATGFREVVQVISEIVLNLVGAARFVLYLNDERRELLVPVAGEGVDAAELPALSLGSGVIGLAAARKERFVRTDGTSEAPLVAVPLASATSLVGVVVIDELLPHKTQLTAVDDELFALLATHAATALSGALLREQAPPEARVIDVGVARALLA
jgi:hypothetical protein